jgi:hypothetical protein
VAVQLRVCSVEFEKERAMANPLSVITKPLSAITSRDWKSPNGANAIVKRDWVPTGRIDFATKIDRDDDPTRH